MGEETDQFLSKYQYLKKDNHFKTSVSKGDVQKWCAVTFFSQKNVTKCESLKSLNKLFVSDEINNIINEITESIKAELLNNLSKLVKNKSEQYKRIKTNKNGYVNRCLHYLEHFNNCTNLNNYIIRYFENDNELLEYKFDNYKFVNFKLLLNEFKRTHNDEVCERGFKIRGVFNEPININTFINNCKEKATTKFSIPIGFHVPWKPYTINNNGYNITDSMVDELNKLVYKYILEKEKNDKDFNERKNKTLKGDRIM